MSPYIDKWPQAMALGLKPLNLPTTFGRLNAISDEIWYLAGDQSSDINWYTKRALLTQVYIMTETFMINDKSKDLIETWHFLDRRLSDVHTLGKFINDNKTNLNSVFNGVSSIFSIFSPKNLKMDDSVIKSFQK